jgi:hypothetical protein
MFNLQYNIKSKSPKLYLSLAYLNCENIIWDNYMLT